MLEGPPSSEAAIDLGMNFQCFGVANENNVMNVELHRHLSNGAEDGPTLKGQQFRDLDLLDLEMLDLEAIATNSKLLVLSPEIRDHFAMIQTQLSTIIYVDLLLIITVML